MNALEKEYRDNVERVKQREVRRGLIAAGVGVALCVAAFVAYAACDSNVQAAIHNGPSDSRWLTALESLLIAGVFGAVNLAWWLRSPGVVVDMSEPEPTTEVERGYRAPVVAKTPQTSRPKSPIPYMLALIPIGIAFVAIGIATDSPHTDYRINRAIPGGVTLTLMGIILVARHLYGAWRARRNARLELEWERWLDSADAGQARAGERAK